MELFNTKPDDLPIYKVVNGIYKNIYRFECLYNEGETFGTNIINVGIPNVLECDKNYSFRINISIPMILANYYHKIAVGLVIKRKKNINEHVLGEGICDVETHICRCDSGYEDIAFCLNAIINKCLVAKSLFIKECDDIYITIRLIVVRGTPEKPKILTVFSFIYPSYKFR